MSAVTSHTTTVRILANQKGSSNKIWAQVITVSDGRGRHEVFHGPIRHNGAGMVANMSSATWRDKERVGYQTLVTFEGVPRGSERECVAAVAHVMDGGMPLYYEGGPFGVNCAGLFRQDKGRFGFGITIDLSKSTEKSSAPTPPEREPERPKPKRDLAGLLKNSRRSAFF